MLVEALLEVLVLVVPQVAVLVQALLEVVVLVVPVAAVLVEDEGVEDVTGL